MVYYIPTIYPVRDSYRDIGSGFGRQIEYVLIAGKYPLPHSRIIRKKHWGDKLIAASGSHPDQFTG